MSHQIEIAVDTVEADEFAAWLNANGHDAKVGNSTGNFIDGVRTSTDNDANETMRALWDAYCNA